MAYLDAYAAVHPTNQNGDPTSTAQFIPQLNLWRGAGDSCLGDSMVLRNDGTEIHNGQRIRIAMKKE
jgi:hypothetical protein